MRSESAYIDWAKPNYIHTGKTPIFPDTTIIATRSISYISSRRKK